MNRYLFTVNTEYHLLLAISIMVDLNRDAPCQHDVILVDGKANRLKNVRVDLGTPFIRFKRIDTSQFEETGKTVRRLSKNNYKGFFHFTEFNTINSYLVSRLKGKSEIMLAEDGTAIYQTYSVEAYGSRFRQTVRRIREAYELGLWHFSIPIEKINHRASKAIDTLWLTHPELYGKNVSGIRAINLLDTQEKKELSNQVFRWDSALLPKENVILYLGRVSYSAQYLEFELEFIREVIRENPQRPFYLKPHPLTTPEQHSRYKEVNGLYFLDLAVPAELLIANLETSLILGVDSTSLYFQNPSCQYSALYVYFQRNGVYPSFRSIPFPEHVKIYGEG